MSGDARAELLPAVAPEAEHGTVAVQPQERATASIGNQTAQAAARSRNPSGDGQPLPPRTAALMQERFDRSFSDVRVHDDDYAAAASERHGARAFTSGRDVYFGAGEFAPESRAGAGLIAHELTHVVQQRDVGSAEPQAKFAFTEPGDAAERAADEAALAVSGGRNVPPSVLDAAPATQPTIARQQVVGGAVPQGGPQFAPYSPPSGGLPGNGLSACARTSVPLGGQFDISGQTWFETEHQGEFGTVYANKLRHHRSVQIQTDDGIEATLEVDGRVDLPLGIDTTGNPENSLDVRGGAYVTFSLVGHAADGMPIDVQGHVLEVASMRGAAAKGPEYIHFDLTAQRQIESIIEAIRCMPRITVAPPAPRTETKPEPPTTEDHEVTEEEFEHQTPDERNEYAKRRFWDEFSGWNVVRNVLIGLGIAVLAILAIVAAIAGAVEIAIGLVIGLLILGLIGIGLVIWDTVKEVMDRWHHGEYLDAFLAALKGVLQIVAIVIGAALVVVGVALAIIGIPLELGALAIAGIVLLGVAIIAITLWLAYRDFERAVGARRMEEFERKIKQSARGLEQAISDGIVIIITFFLGPIVKWIMGRSRVPIVDLPPEEKGGPPPPPPAPEGNQGSTTTTNQPPPRVLQLEPYEERWPEYMRRDRLQNPPATDPERTTRMGEAIERYRRQPGVPPRVDVQGQPGVEGGTVAVTETDVPTLEGRRFPGASSGALPEPLRGTPGTTGGDVLEPVNPTAVDHAEQVSLENLRVALESGLSDGSIKPGDLQGRTVFVLVEQEPCASCASGAGGGPPGVLQQFSQLYPELTIEVRNMRTSRVYFYRGGELLNP